MKSAIYLQPEAYEKSGDVMGRNVAGNDFLRAYLRYSEQDKWFQIPRDTSNETVASLLKSIKFEGTVNLIRPGSIQQLSQIGSLQYPGPDIEEVAKIRSIHGPTAYSICGVTHTTASHRIMDAISNIPGSHIEPWDAIICTSNSVRSSVETLLNAQEQYLSERLGAKSFIRPHLPVIPLGIHTEDFVFSPEFKRQSRSKVTTDDAIVIGYVGRLSFHAKSHPLVLYRTLSRIQNETKKNIILIECGWYPNTEIEKSYLDAHRKFAPNIQVVKLDGRKAENVSMTYAASDIFCSLVDNYQETFGITPLEAMASGIPVLVTDWDGYKDTVKNGEVGYRVKTKSLPIDMGEDFAYRYATGIDTYDRYCGHLSSYVAVDTDDLHQKIKALITDNELRNKLGKLEQIHAKEYDWSVIYKQYENLWSELNNIRINASRTDFINSIPSRISPYRYFETYPTGVISENDYFMLCGNKEEALKEVDDILELFMVNFAKAILPKKENIIIVINEMVEEKQLKAIISEKVGMTKPEILKITMFLLKHRIIRETGAN